MSVVATSSRFRYEVADTNTTFGALMISASQSRMARAALNLGVREVAEAASVSTNTITRLERGEELLPRTVADIRAAFEAAGVVFLEDGELIDGGAGVRLARK
ncbi:helix-turn-helix domain-containing protein [Bradyrhizobium genosp. L]|uniref:helix-turn-helix domain-containing protein n=1 Tax=Bradyrhizobium genosp. L TaxID=83637 RepID=UPI003D9B96C9